MSPGTGTDLRVLMTADALGGVWTYACELIGALADEGVEVVLATMGAPLSAAQRRAVRALPNAELVESAFALEWMPDPWRDVDAAADWLRGLQQRYAPDAVHVNGYALAALGGPAPVICVAHRRATASPEYCARVSRGLRDATEVVAPTRARLATLLRAYGVPRSGRVIPNGRSAAAYRPRRKEPFVLAAGRRWDETKGLGELAACARRLRWPIRVAGAVVGDGDGLEPLGALSPDALAAWMARASIYALPARRESFGLSVLEAALAGCTLVLGDLPALREAWGADAVYVPPRDLSALAFALDALIRDPLWRGALAAGARARALRLTPRRMAAAYRALYDELIAAPSSQEVCA